MIGIYCRKSAKSSHQGTELSIKEQQSLGIEYAKKLGIKKYKVYIDEYISGTKIDRPALNELRTDLHDGLIDSIFFQDQSRLDRNPELWNEFKQLRKTYGLTFYTTGGLFNLDDLNIEFASDVLSLVNSHYVKLTKDKVNRVLERKAREGKYPSGRMPFGLKRDKEGFVVKDEANVKYVELIFKMFFKGNGYRVIANKINDLGVPALRGSMWTPTSIEYIIKNKCYFGEIKWREYTFKIPEYFPMSDYDLIAKRIKKNLTKKGKPITKGYILRGTIKCSDKGCNKRTLNVYAGSTGHKYYRCGSKQQYNIESCKLPVIQMQWIDKLVWYIASKSRTLKQDVINLMNLEVDNTKIDDLKASIKNLDIERDKLEKQRRNLIKLAAEGVLDNEDIVSEMKSIKTKLSDNENILKDNKRKLESYEINIEDTLSDIDYAEKVKRPSRSTKIAIIQGVFKTITYFKTKDPLGYEITLQFHNPNIPNIVYFMDFKYRYAKSQAFYTLVMNPEPVVELQEHFIRLNTDLPLPAPNKMPISKPTIHPNLKKIIGDYKIETGKDIFIKNPTLQ